MIHILLMVLVLLPVNSVLADDPKVAFSFSRDCVEKIRHQKPLPDLKLIGYPKLSPYPHKPLPQEVRESLEALEKSEFKIKENFKIFYIPEGHFMATIEMNSRTIELGDTYSLFSAAVPVRNKQIFIAMLISHEMGHYFYEICKNPDTFNHGQVDAIGMYLMDLAGFNVEVLRNGKFLDYILEAMSTLDPHYKLYNAASFEERRAFINSYLGYRSDGRESPLYSCAKNFR